MNNRIYLEELKLIKKLIRNNKMYMVSTVLDNRIRELQTVLSDLND